MKKFLRGIGVFFASLTIVIGSFPMVPLNVTAAGGEIGKFTMSSGHVHTNECYQIDAPVAESTRLADQVCEHCGGTLQVTRHDFTCRADWDTFTTYTRYCQNEKCPQRSQDIRGADAEAHNGHKITDPNGNTHCGQNGTNVGNVSVTSSETGLTNQPITLSATPQNIISGATSTLKWAGTDSSSLVISQNGEYTLNWEATYNGVTNKGSQKYTISNFDYAGPAITITPDTTAIVGEVTLTVSASDPAGVPTDAFSFDGTTFSSVNTITVYENKDVTVYAKDVLGNVSSKIFTVTNIDEDGPIISFSQDISDPTQGNVIVSVSASDVVGLASAPFSYDGGATYSNKTTYTFTDNGTLTVYAKDSKGNISNNSYTVSNIDREKPSLTITADVTVPTGGDVILSLRGTDERRLADAPYSIDGTTYIGDATNPYQVTVTENGTYKYYVKDFAGNVGNEEYTVDNIDKQGPDISLSLNVTGATNQDVIIKAKATDKNGLADEAYSFDGVSYQAENTKKVSSNGKYTVYAKDVFGNVSSKSINVSNIDRTAPTVGYSLSTTDITCNDVIVTVSASDSSGISGNAYCYDGVNYEASNTHAIGANGTYTYYVRDNVGNVSSFDVTVNNIDKSKPAINYTLSTEELTNQDVVITLRGNDDNGLSAKPYSADGNEYSETNTFMVSKNGSYTYFVKDKAGNVSSTIVEIGNIDKKGPEITVNQKSGENCGEIILTISATDENGLDIAPYSFNKGSYSANGEITVNENGDYDICAKDSLGNVSTTIYSVSTIRYAEPNETEDPEVLDNPNDDGSDNVEETEPEKDIVSKKAKTIGDVFYISDNDTPLALLAASALGVIANIPIPVAAATTTTAAGGSGFFVFFFFFMGTKAGVFSLDGFNYKKIGKASIKKKKGIYTVKITGNTSKKVTSSDVVIKMPRRIVRKHAGEMCEITCNGKTVVARIAEEISISI